MTGTRSYSDDQLTEAVAAAHSWRGVLRALGLAATSSGAMRSVRRHADRLGLDYGHFTGRRRWSDAELKEAVAGADSWLRVADLLGLAGGSNTATLKGHAVRLGLDFTHFAPPPHDSQDAGLCPHPANLRRAGSLMAAAWFELCGLQVSWPLEPCRYDLLVWHAGRAERIQVKTTTIASGGSWTVFLSNSGKARRRYDPDEIDQFFIVDGNFCCYLIPVGVVGGLTSISLAAYQHYRVRTDLEFAE